MGVIAAERIKLTSTRSPWWCSAIVAALGLGFAALFAYLANNQLHHPPKGNEQPLLLTPDIAASGVEGFGVMVLMIMAALMVTSEYRFGIIRTTFQATPNRVLVILTKAGLAGLLSAVLTGVLAALSFGIAKAMGGDAATLSLHLDTAGQWRSMYGIPIYAFLASVLAVAVGVLVRQSAAAISIVVLWPLLIEGLLGNIGSFGDTVKPFLPFANAARFLAADNARTSAHWHWGAWGGLAYFTFVVAVVLAAALYSVRERDA
ncbi:ABC transporter permease [Nocardia stercoris]|uniref:ABC transporter permease n=1 Tax=Nocardia stercoris TaxID=2483361 RepID=A0A3M2L9P8_9NOCA|nr:ABC transporter permease [Nocardia stercoris]RMI34329.1 ABC transporter permease [Nocardia stercoris]